MWYYVVGVEIPNPQFQEQKEGSQLPPSCKRSPGRYPLLTDPPGHVALGKSIGEVFIHSLNNHFLASAIHQGHGSERWTSLPSLAEDGCSVERWASPEIRWMLDTSEGSPRQGNGWL